MNKYTIYKPYQFTKTSIIKANILDIDIYFIVLYNDFKSIKIGLINHYSYSDNMEYIDSLIRLNLNKLYLTFHATLRGKWYYYQIKKNTASGSSYGRMPGITYGRFKLISNEFIKESSDQEINKEFIVSVDAAMFQGR